jgi:hypothetical protein
MNEERPIEKLLRRYAKKRRDAAGPAQELHPATRRVLQGEVARQFPKPTSKERSALDEFVATFSRRWIHAAITLVVLMVAAAVMLPTMSKSKSKTHLAQNKPLSSPSEAMNTPEPAAFAPMPATAVMDGLANAVVTNAANVALGSMADFRRDEVAHRKLEVDRDFRSGGGNLVTSSDSADIKPTSPQILENLGVASTGTKSKRETSLLLGAASETRNADVTTTANTDLTVNTTKGSVANSLMFDKAGLARGGGAQDKDAEFSLRQSFLNDQPLAKEAIAASGKLSVIAPVLASFRIEQSGNKLRVIDGDGSTYLGEVAPDQPMGVAQSGAYKNDGKEMLAYGLKAGPQNQADSAYQFRVTGTNRTLNQQVVFAWNCVPMTNAQALSNNSFAASELKKLDAAKMPQQFPGFQNAIINGRAQIASEKEIEINARPVFE